MSRSRKRRAGTPLRGPERAAPPSAGVRIIAEDTNAADRQVEAKLNENLPELSFDEQPAEEVFDYFVDLTGLNFYNEVLDG